MNNRIIKFRVWDKHQNKFLPSYGNLGVDFYHEQGESWHSKGIRDIVPVSWFLTDHNNNLGNYIVQQYTGLNDSKGKEIYEGDILNCDLVGGDDPQTVILKNGTFTLDYLTPGCYNLHDEINQTVGHRVVGNIFENPELLK